jgi:hypothetical protein
VEIGDKKVGDIGDAAFMCHMRRSQFPEECRGGGYRPWMAEVYCCFFESSDGEELFSNS